MFRVIISFKEVLFANYNGCALLGHLGSNLFDFKNLLIKFLSYLKLSWKYLVYIFKFNVLLNFAKIWIIIIYYLTLLSSRMTTLVIGLSPSRHSAALATAAALADREDSQLCSKFDQLCSSLNVDFSLRTDASSQFKYVYVIILKFQCSMVMQFFFARSVRRQYALEGEPHHWLACALALAQRRVSHRSSSLLVHHLLSAASMRLLITYI